MRRLSAFLMIATLLVALVPSVALAGKPLPPAVQGAEVKGVGNGLYGTCDLNFWVSFDGRAYGIRWQRWADGELEYALTTVLPRKQTGLSYEESVPDLGTKGYTWKVALVDRKDKVVGTEVETTLEWWVNPHTCPTGSIKLAGYPAWMNPTPTFAGNCAARGGTYSASYEGTAGPPLEPACLWNGISETAFEDAKPHLRGFCPVYVWGTWSDAVDPDFFGCTIYS